MVPVQERGSRTDAICLSRMNCLIISLAAVLVSTSATSAETKNSGNGCRGLSEKVIALISQYQELRERRRRSPEGTYDKELRDHGGKFHRVLTSLGIELGHPPFAKRT